MITPTISWPEAIVTVFVLLAIGLKSIELYDSWLDLHAANTDRRWETHFLARGNVRTNILHLLVKVVILAYVGYADLQPPANPLQPVTRFGLVLYGGLFVIIALLLTATFFQRSDRRVILTRLSLTGRLEALQPRVAALESKVEFLVRAGEDRDGRL